MSAEGTAPRSGANVTTTVRLASIEGPNFRLDAKHYQEEFTLARNRVATCGYASAPLRTFAAAFVPARTKLVTTASASAGAPYLRAHDAFEVRPSTRRYVSRARTEDYEAYKLKQGMLLTPSSGRNLGPIAYVGELLSRFAMTDILRIVPRDKSVGFYLLAYLLTPTGQALVRRGRTGTTVDHLAPDDVLGMPVVQLPETMKKRVVDAIRTAEERLDGARLRLDQLELELHNLIGLKLPPPKGKVIVQLI